MSYILFTKSLTCFVLIKSIIDKEHLISIIFVNKKYIRAHYKVSPRAQCLVATALVNFNSSKFMCIINLILENNYSSSQHPINIYK
jgi:flagellar assembly factor FliW